MSSWELAGIRSAPEGQKCDHCPRTLKNLYDVRNTATGETMTVGRGCCKAVTGWTLTLAQARQEIQRQEAAKRAQDRWDTFAEAFPRESATMAADLAAGRAKAGHFVGAIERDYGVPRSQWGDHAARYMAIR